MYLRLGPIAFICLVSLAWIAQLVEAHRVTDTSLGHAEPRRHIRDAQLKQKYRLLKAYRYARSGQTIPSAPHRLHDLIKRESMAPGQPFFASEQAKASSAQAATVSMSTSKSGTATVKQTSETSPISRVSSRISFEGGPSPLRASGTTSASLPSTPFPTTSPTSPTDPTPSSIAPPTSTSSSSSDSSSSPPSASSSTRVLLTTMPGRTLAVFPIGLVVFGSLNALLILVTLYMLWERRGYARQFEDRKRQEKERRQASEAAVVMQ